MAFSRTVILEHIILAFSMKSIWSNKKNVKIH